MAWKVKIDTTVEVVIENADDAESAERQAIDAAQDAINGTDHGWPRLKAKFGQAKVRDIG